MDVHVHLNEPGRVHWEGFETGTKAAAAGGVTTLVDMPLNSNPTVVDAETFDLKLKASANKLHVDVAFWGGLVPDNARNQTKLKALIDAGVVGLKAFMSPSGIGDFENASVDDLKLAMRTLNAHHVPLMAHAELLTPVEEDPDADPRKYATYLATRPRVWEKVRKSYASDATTLLEPENARTRWIFRFLPPPRRVVARRVLRFGSRRCPPPLSRGPRMMRSREQRKLIFSRTTARAARPGPDEKDDCHPCTDARGTETAPERGSDETRSDRTRPDSRLARTPHDRS